MIFFSNKNLVNLSAWYNDETKGNFFSSMASKPIKIR